MPAEPAWLHADGPFLVGANLPWIDYGWDFGRNAWSPEGGVSRPEKRRVSRDLLLRLSDSGIECVRWFVLCDGRAGIRFDDRGWPAGPDESLFEDLDHALAIVREARLTAILVLFDYLWFARRTQHAGVSMGGHDGVATDPDCRRSLLNSVLRPLLERYGRHQEIAAWDIVNEPEYGIRRQPVPFGGKVSLTVMRDFIGDIVRLVHELTPQLATVGSASTRTLSMVRGLGLDFYQAHWYDIYGRRADPGHDVARFGLDKPIILGEFPTRNSNLLPSEVLSKAEAAGYRGALAWSAAGSDRWSDAGRLFREVSQWLRRA